MIHTPKISDSNVSICKGKYDQYIYTNRFKYAELETFVTFYDDCIAFKKYFVKEFDSQALSETNDANSIKHLEDKINELQNKNKQLNDENRTLSEVIKFMRINV